MKIKVVHFPILLLFIISPITNSNPLNYSFSIKNLEEFSPGKNFDLNSESNKQVQLIEESGENKIIHFTKKYGLSSLDVYLHLQNNLIDQTFVRFPQHLLHDFILDELQKTYLKQQRFQRFNKTGIYRWENVLTFHLQYEAHCSITCFPLYLWWGRASSNSLGMMEKMKAHMKKN